MSKRSFAKIITAILGVLFASLGLAACLVQVPAVGELNSQPVTLTAVQTALPTAFQPATATIPVDAAFTEIAIKASETPTASATPSPEPSPTPTCQDLHGRILPGSIDSSTLGQPMQFNIYLPPCYNPEASSGYPVLYMLHGQTFTQDQWVNLGMTAEADDLIANDSISPFLIVMPFEKDSFAYPFTSGFEEAIVDELIPWVDQTYNTCATRACRAIGGLSRGGAWAIHLGFSHWQLFGAIGGHSPVPFGGDVQNLYSWQGLIPAGKLPLIYLDIGQSDIYLPNATEFEQQLTHLGIPHGWIVQSGNHSEAYWRSHVKQYVLWYADFFQNTQRDGEKNE